MEPPRGGCRSPNTGRGGCGREERFDVGRSSGAAKSFLRCRRTCREYRKRGRGKSFHAENPDGYPDVRPIAQKCSGRLTREASIPEPPETVRSHSSVSTFPLRQITIIWASAANQQQA